MSEFERWAQAAWIAYRNDVQRQAPWENHRRAMRRLRKREFIAGFLAALMVPVNTAGEGERGEGC